MYWLFKEDPETYSFEALLKEEKTSWSGVRNNLALKYLRQVEKNDLIFFYETGDEKKIVGTMKATSDAYSLDKEKLLGASKEIAVDVVPLKRIENPVSLSQIKQDNRFKDFLLVKLSRLSVMPVSEERWNEILSLSTA